MRLLPERQKVSGGAPFRGRRARLYGLRLLIVLFLEPPASVSSVGGWFTESGGDAIDLAS